MGCGSRVSTDWRDYVGEYVFQPNNADPGRFASFVILKQDHTALEVRFSKQTGQVAINQEKWYLIHTTAEDLVIGDFRCTIEGSRPIRLMVNYDLGLNYEKVR